jgi:subtilisin family serine protease
MKNFCRLILVGFSFATAGFVHAAPKQIPGKYIVTLAPGAGVEAVAARHGAAVDAVYMAALHGFAGTVAEARLRALQNDPEVIAVEPDVEVQAFPHQVTLAGGDTPMLTVNGETIPTGVARTGVNPRVDVSAVSVAVIDTGISLTHPDLNVAGGVSYIKGNKNGNDDNGHGSHVAGTIGARINGSGVQGVAPNARLFAVKVLDRFGSGSLSAVISGIDWVRANAASQGIKVANMSLGFQGTSAALTTALNNSVAAGVTYVVAAGNSAADAQYFSPANHPAVITVSAIADSDGQCGGGGAATGYGADDTFASFSNWGTPIDIAAPGVNILSTYKDGGYATMSGTSMASPHTAGAAALVVASHPGATPADVKAALLSVATPQTQGCGLDAITGAVRGGFTGDPDGAPEPLLDTRGL